MGPREAASDHRRAAHRQRPGAGAGARDSARAPRALRRHRVPARSARQRDPARGADRRRRRRVRRDDRIAALPRHALGGRSAGRVAAQRRHEVADNKNDIFGGPTLAQETEHAVGVIMAIDPLEPVGLTVPFVQRRLGAIQAV